MNIGSDLSFFSLIMGASLPVQLVMIILIFASIISWKFIYLKIKFLKRSEENSQEFEKFFWSGGDLARLYDSLGTNGKDMTGLAEIFRSGFEAVPKGQNEAGTSLGMRFYERFRLIILPQAIKIILPALGNQFVYMLKMSSLVSIIGLNELTRKANELVVSQYRPLEIYTFLVLEYLVLILVISYLVRRMEKKLTN